MNHFRHYIPAAASLFLCAAIPSFAQTATPASPRQPKPAPAPVAAPAPAPPAVADPADPFGGTPEKRFDVSYKDATAEEAVADLGHKLGYPINVVFAGKSGSTQLPDLELRNVTLSEYFAAVKAAGALELKEGRPGSEFAMVPGASNIYTFSVLQPPVRSGYGQFHSTSPGEALANRLAAGGGLAASPVPPAVPASGPVVAPPMVAPAEALRGALAQPSAPAARMYGGLYAQPAPEKSTLFFDLSKVLDGKLTIEDITTAIRTGWTAAADGKEPGPDALKFHQESKLLIATGPPAHLEAVTSIVRLLENRRLPTKDEQERAIEGLRLRIEESAQQNHRLEEKLNEMEKLKEATVRDLRDQITKLELELAKRARPQ